MKKAQEHEIYLTDDQPCAFDLLVDWIYTKKVRVLGQVSFTRKLPLIKAFVLADKLCMPDFQDANHGRNTEIDFKLHRTPQLLIWINQHGPPRLEMRQYLLDQLVCDLLAPECFQDDVGTTESEKIAEDLGMETAIGVEILSKERPK